VFWRCKVTTGKDEKDILKVGGASCQISNFTLYPRFKKNVHFPWRLPRCPLGCKLKTMVPLWCHKKGLFSTLRLNWIHIDQLGLIQPTSIDLL